MQVKFYPAEAGTEIAEGEIQAEYDLAVGSFVRVMLPVVTETKNLLPITALSFEPDGAEVFVIDDQNIVQRQKITIGKLIGDSIEVYGLTPETLVVRYRSRVNVGEKVSATNEPLTAIINTSS